MYRATLNGCTPHTTMSAACPIICLLFFDAPLTFALCVGHRKPQLRFTDTPKWSLTFCNTSTSLGSIGVSEQHPFPWQSNSVDLKFADSCTACPFLYTFIPDSSCKNNSLSACLLRVSPASTLPLLLL